MLHFGLTHCFNEVKLEPSPCLCHRSHQARCARCRTPHSCKQLLENILSTFKSKLESAKSVAYSLWVKIPAPPSKLRTLKRLHIGKPWGQDSRRLSHGTLASARALPLAIRDMASRPPDHLRAVSVPFFPRRRSACLLQPSASCSRSRPKRPRISVNPSLWCDNLSLVGP